jgi:hypothetical protein
MKFPVLFIEFEASLKGKYDSRRFIFDCSQGERGVWRLVKKFKLAGNHFHGLRVFTYYSELAKHHDFREDIHQLDLYQVNDINNLSWSEFIRKYELSVFDS